jgi:hypothetical protein
MAVRWSVLRVCRGSRPRKITVTHFCYTLSQLPGHSAAGRIMYIEQKINYVIGYRPRDLPAYSIVPQQTKLPGRAVAQAVSRRLPTAKARVRSCGICGRQSGTGSGFLRVLRFSLQSISPITQRSSSSGAGTLGQ